MDKVFISGLRADSVIGAYDWEREIRQQLVIDLELSCDTRKARESDALEDALDYAEVSRRVVEQVEASSFQLLEALAEHLAQLILREFAVATLTLSLTKPGAVPQADAVGVRITRGAVPD